jgi:hypothetical protein
MGSVKSKRHHQNPRRIFDQSMGETTERHAAQEMEGFLDSG